VFLRNVETIGTDMYGYELLGGNILKNSSNDF